MTTPAPSVPEPQPPVPTKTPVPVTVRPAPPREPPFDDELPARHLHVVGPHDLRLPFDSLPLRRVAPLGDPFAARVTRRHDLTDPAAWARRLLVALVETLAGRRPAQQLSPFTSPSVQSGLAIAVERSTLIATGRDWASPATVRSVRVCEPADGVAEVAATVQTAGRVRAIALRLEGLDGRWRCTRLQIG